jgi:hypothetical protein
VIQGRRPESRRGRQGDSKDHLIYGPLNSVDDPDKPTKSGEQRKLPEIAETIFHRSREKMDTLPYSAFGTSAPRGFLPELRTIDTSEYDVSAKPHHKFIVIDGDTTRTSRRSTRTRRTSARRPRTRTMRTCWRSRGMSHWQAPTSPNSCASTITIAPARYGTGRMAAENRKVG